MNMKGHILAALSEQFDNWEELLTSMDEKHITAPHFDYDWSIKDVIAHLWAWQQISIARMEAGVRGREPEYPRWIVKIGENWEEDADRVNALTFEMNHEKPWAEIRQNWREVFWRFLKSGEPITEKDLFKKCNCFFLFEGVKFLI